MPHPFVPFLRKWAVLPPSVQIITVSNCSNTNESYPTQRYSAVIGIGNPGRETDETGDFCDDAVQRQLNKGKKSNGATRMALGTVSNPIFGLCVCSLPAIDRTRSRDIDSVQGTKGIGPSRKWKPSGHVTGAVLSITLICQCVKFVHSRVRVRKKCSVACQRFPRN